jgi:hypothetical protein
VPHGAAAGRSRDDVPLPPLASLVRLFIASICNGLPSKAVKRQLQQLEGLFEVVLGLANGLPIKTVQRQLRRLEGLMVGVQGSLTREHLEHNNSKTVSVNLDI